MKRLKKKPPPSKTKPLVSSRLDLNLIILSNSSFLRLSLDGKAFSLIKDRREEAKYFFSFSFDFIQN